MYIRDKLVKILKIKNVIFSVLGIFNIIVSAGNIISLTVYYRDQLETVLYAKSTPSSIIFMIIGVIVLVIASISKRLIGDAYFYSSYFECDLDGYVKYDDLAELTGKSEAAVKKQLHIFRKIYMKNYEIKAADGSERVELYSKKCICECRGCGAVIEKKIYFTGVCPYCSGSDLRARVLSNDSFYSITNDMSNGIKNPNYYSAKHLVIKKVLFLCGSVLGMSIVVVAAIACLDQIMCYNDKAYLTEVLLADTRYSSFALIKADLIDSMIIWLVIMLAFMPIVQNSLKRTKYILTADVCSRYFSKCKTPFVKAINIPSESVLSNKKSKIGNVRGAIRRGYLKNCTLEKHYGSLKIALAKKVVKDECPSCGGAIFGAVDEHYKCQYCGNMIMNVVCKK